VFDVVVMNPPFGELSESVKKYLEGAYPNSKTNLLTIFVERVLFTSERGRLGHYIQNIILSL
jgi:tRNA1(Val) A37 N6-methylase TrmN6